MSSRSALPGLPGSTTLVVLVALLAGCASRSLNAPPVEDWSDRAIGPPTTAPATAVVAPPVFHTVRREDTLASIAKRYNVAPADLATWNNLGPNPRLLPNQILRVSPPAPAPAADANAPIAIAQPIGGGTVEQRPLGSAPSSSPPPPTSTSNAPLKTGPLGVKRPYSDAALAELSRPDGEPGSSSVAPAPSPAVVEPPAAPSPAAPVGGVAWAWPAAGKPGEGFGDGKSKGVDIAGKAGDAVLAAADGKVTFSGTGVRGYGNFIIVQHTPDLLSVYAHNRANLVKEGMLVTRGQKIAEMGNSESENVRLHFEIRSDSKPVDPLKYLPAR